MHHDPIIGILNRISEHAKRRAFYYLARLIVVVLFASILFFPHQLSTFLHNPPLLVLLIFGPLVLAVTLFVDLLHESQRSVGSLMFKYFFLTLSVILAYGLFYYVDATLIQPPGLHYSAVLPDHELERDVFYLSATTYFTIGYGDITPLGTDARAAAVSEAFVGSIINLIVLAMAFQRLTSNPVLMPQPAKKR